MLERIINVLKQSEADGYQIVRTLTKSHEFFFIKNKLDMNRAKEVVHNNVTVFKKIEDGKFLGSSSIEVFDSSDDDEMKQMIDKAIYSASFVKNPYYELASPTTTTANENASSDILAIAKDFIEVMQEINVTPTEDINSYEIFVNENERRIVNSSGVDVSFSFVDSMLEVVVNARKGAEEIELYRNYVSGSCDKTALKNEIEETLNIGKDKCIAVDTPALKETKVLFSSASAVPFFRYYTANTNAASIYTKTSTYEVNKPVNDEVINGDKVTIKCVVELDNSSSNFPYDSDGNVVYERYLVEDGVCKNLWGAQQFSQYLNLEKSSMVYNLVVNGGSKSVEELRTGKYLEAIEFSDFQVHPMTGDFAGEIRLAYYHDGDKITVCTGGSISGNMKKAETQMWFSTEVKQYNNYVIPAVIAIEEVSVTGIE